MRGRFRLGPWVVHPAANRLTRVGSSVERGAAPDAGRVVRVEPRVMQLLVALADRAGEVVPRQALLDTVWAGAFVTDEALTTAVYQLRGALGDDARHARFIETVPKGGYRLLAGVELLPEPAGERVPLPACDPSEAGSPARPRRLAWGGAARRWSPLLAGALLAALGLVLASRDEREVPRSVSAPASSLPAASAEAPGPGAAVGGGWQLLERTRTDDVAAALALFERAVADDPRDPLAQAGLAEALVRARAHGLPAPAGSDPWAAAAAGVALGPQVAATHRALAYVLFALDWDFAGAEAELRHALTLDPQAPRVHSLLAQVHFVSGRREAAMESIARARRLAPDSAAIQGLAGTLASVLGRPDLAERAFLVALDLEPGAEGPLRGLAKLRSARRESGESAMGTGAREGLDRLASMAHQGPVPPSHVAALYAEIGDEREAVAWLDRAWRARDPGLFFLRYDSRWRPYREHPRVRELLGRLSAS